MCVLSHRKQFWQPDRQVVKVQPMGKDTTKELLKLANEAAASAENLRALTLYREAHQGERLNIDALMGIALSATRLKEPSEANAAYIQLVEIYIGSNRMRHAASAIARVLSTEPDHPLALRFATFVSSRLAPEKPTKSDSAATEFEASSPSKPSSFGLGTKEQRMARGSVQLHDSKRTPTPLFVDEDTVPVPEELLKRLTRISTLPENSAKTKPDPHLAALSAEDIFQWEAQTSVAIASMNSQVKQNDFGLSAPSHPSFESIVYPSIDEQAVVSAARSTSDVTGRQSRTELDELIESSPLLATLGPAQARELLVRSEIIQWKAGQTIALQGQELTTLFVVLRGEVTLETRAQRGGVSVASVNAGDFFGEGALLARTNQIATAKTVTEAIVAEIPLDLAEQQLSNQPAMLTVMARRLRERLITVLLTHQIRLAGLDDSEERALRPCLALVRMRPGEVLVSDGNPEPRFCFLLTGELESSAETARLFPVSILGSNHEQLAAGTPRQEVVVIESSWLLTMSGNDYASLPFHVRRTIAEIARS